MPRKGERRPKPPVGDTRDPDSLYHHMLRYLAFLAEKNYSPRTIEEREKFLRYFILWCDDRGITRPGQLDRPILERYQRHLFYWRKADGEPLSIGSQSGRIIPIRHCLQWLVKQRRLLYNPAAELDMPRIEKRLPKAILTAREAELFRDLDLERGTVFLSQLGLAFEPGRVTDRVRRIVDEAGIGKNGEEEPGPTVDDLLEALAREAEEDEEG